MHTQYPLSLLILALAILPGVGFSQHLTDLRPRDNQAVGYIPHDPALDKRDFKLCGGTIQQYYAVDGGHQGGRKRLLGLLAQQPALQGARSASESGYITVRFVVNCEGETDRFRVLQIDKSYQPTEFHSELVEDLLSFSKRLTDWLPAEYQGNHYDYYQYLTFKITDGKVVDILP